MTEHNIVSDTEPASQTTVDKKEAVMSNLSRQHGICAAKVTGLPNTMRRVGGNIMQLRLQSHLRRLAMLQISWQ